jgi:DNA-binding NarL/FixJ family response regulator
MSRISAALLNPLSLTPRESDILRLLCVGYSDKAIGHALGISNRTVQSHLQAIYKKLDINQSQGNTRGVLQAISQAKKLVDVSVSRGDRRCAGIRDGERRKSVR